MRLIDADALNDAMYRMSFETDDGRQQWDSGLWIRYKVFEEARDEAPTIDAVPVVRCKDCKHWLKGDGSCSPHADYNDFCSNGERKDNEDR